MTEKIDIDELLFENKDRITTLRHQLGDLVVTKDDIWLLRYCLSYKKEEKAILAIKFALEYQQQNQDWLQRATSEGLAGAPHREQMKKYSCSTIHGTQLNGGPILIIRAGLAEPSKMMSNLTVDEVTEFLLFQDEVAYLQCDRVTRETRQLTKLLVINDMRGFNLLNNSQKFFEALGKSSKISEKLYPQLLQKTVTTNPLFIYKILLNCATLFVSKRTMSKFAYCKGNTLTGDVSKCPFAKNYLNPKNLPTFLGGNCTCAEKNGCVDAIPNHIWSIPSADK